uniref:Protein PHLOEM PROTEIN 2-LIKE A2 n=1 Tax=Noccaea caerulescens TaxID=107243 RepID=A0A1J3CC87_NOCCA
MGIIWSTFSMPKAPHNYEAILKNADSPLPPDTTSSLDKLYPKLFDGVFLKHKTQKYWIEGRAKKNCFMLYARGLTISLAESQTNNYWIWFSDLDQTSSDAIIEFAKLEWVAWLEVVGIFETENLTPNCLYEVVFVVKLIDPSQGWEVPVNFKLVLPTGEIKERKENMNLLERNRWMEIPVGEFRTSPEYISGKIEFSMNEVKGGLWKSGLIVKGVAIRPQNK